MNEAAGAGQAAAGKPAISCSDITVVMQGGLGGPLDVRYTMQFMREIFRGARFILATQKSEVKDAADYDGFDEVVLTRDPGALPSLKFGGAAHNVNRQIVSSAAGLARVDTPFAMKLRSDAYLTSTKIVDFLAAWLGAPRGDRATGRGRLLVASMFTLNPRYDERMPFHVSDWITFGYTEDVRRMWTCPQYDFGSATWYERHAHAAGSLPREREFRARFGPEQWLTLHYLYGRDAFPIRYHNDCSAELIAAHEAELADNFLVVHPNDVDLRIPKYQRACGSRYANLRNYSYNEWKLLVRERVGYEGPFTGFSAWPRTEFQKALYLIWRRRRRVKYPRRRG